MQVYYIWEDPVIIINLCVLFNNFSVICLQNIQKYKEKCIKNRTFFFRKEYNVCAFLKKS